MLKLIGKSPRLASVLLLFYHVSYKWLYCVFQEETPKTDAEIEQEEALKRSFRKLAGDDMEIDCFELREILNNVFKRGLSFKCLLHTLFFYLSYIENNYFLFLYFLHERKFDNLMPECVISIVQGRL